jgi:hypothetical protein
MKTIVINKRKEVTGDAIWRQDRSSMGYPYGPEITAKEEMNMLKEKSRQNF